MNGRAARLAVAILALLALWPTGPMAAGASPAEERKIEYLIGTIEALQGAQFIRNGTSYDAHAAAEHLRLKRRQAGSHVTTAEDFIRYCASVSSMSGLPYRIRFVDGHEMASAAFLRAQLANFRGTLHDDPRPVFAGAP